MYLREQCCASSSTTPCSYSSTVKNTSSSHLFLLRTAAVHPPKSTKARQSSLKALARRSSPCGARSTGGAGKSQEEQASIHKCRQQQQPAVAEIEVEQSQLHHHHTNSCNSSRGYSLNQDLNLFLSILGYTKVQCGGLLSASIEMLCNHITEAWRDSNICSYPKYLASAFLHHWQEQNKFSPNQIKQEQIQHQQMKQQQNPVTKRSPRKSSIKISSWSEV